MLDIGTKRTANILRASDPTLREYCWNLRISRVRVRLYSTATEERTFLSPGRMSTLKCWVSMTQQLSLKRVVQILKPKLQLGSRDYLNVTDSDASEIIDLDAALAVTQSDAHYDTEAFILTNGTAEIQSHDKNSNSQQTTRAGKKLSVSNEEYARVEEHFPEDKEGSLLESIIHYFREKLVAEETYKDIEGPLLELQIQELESSFKANIQRDVDLESSTASTKSLRKNHAFPSWRKTQNAAGDRLSPAVESVEENNSARVNYIYDECPTTPNVTIAFTTGEKVMPADTIFVFPHKARRVTGDNHAEHKHAHRITEMWRCK